MTGAQAISEALCSYGRPYTPRFTRAMNHAISETLAALVFPVLVTAAPPTRCSISVNPFAVPPEATYLWAVFTPDMVPASGGEHHQRRESRGHWSAPDSAFPLQGQIVAVGGALGRSARAVTSGLGRDAMSRAVLVLWDHDAACEPVPFRNAGEPWGIPGDTVVMAAQLRPRHQWLSGLPTLDVFYGGEGIYPLSRTKHGREFADFLEKNPVEGLTRPAKYLSPVQAFELVGDLPSRCDHVDRPRRAAIRLWWASRKWSRKRDHYPVADVLDAHRALQQPHIQPPKYCAEGRSMDGA